MYVVVLVVDVEGFCCEGRDLAVANVGGVGSWKFGFRSPVLGYQMDSYIIRLVSLLICSGPQQTRLLSSYTAARKLLSAPRKGFAP